VKAISGEEGGTAAGVCIGGGVGGERMAAKDLSAWARMDWVFGRGEMCEGDFSAECAMTFGEIP
jgi:hypothetical protein